MTTTDETTADETTAGRFGLGDRPRRASGLAGLARKKSNPESTAPAPKGLDAIPDPAIAYGESLTDADRADLELCEQAVRSHHATFWMTGKALDAVAKRHLYRARYANFDALLEDWDVTLADSSRMRRGWPLAARLLPDVPKLTRSHVEALLPVVERYGVDAAATLHAMLREALPKVTAKAITDVVRELPGPRNADESVDAIRHQAEKILTEPDQEQRSEEKEIEDAGDPALRQAVSKRARQLADELKRGRISQRELTNTLAAAFADTEDPRVYQALLRWMKSREGKGQ
ncbi:hypothetical protein PV334_33535 [Streptomyces sp. ME02-7008A-1]|uniref:hypothetical protein n=1 Tax=unclassified Streptomyces TaxID=2593676 RepID=UPI0029ADE8C7|nr:MULTISPECIES: hypothetical protein [unclassified Streptomyces]MDX3186164.1 hypothetical protein [Streptomyces sp. ME02-7008A-1]MDX3307097.1 hypothetical protein [Streptomyces sp. ME02-7008A]